MPTSSIDQCDRCTLPKFGLTCALFRGSLTTTECYRKASLLQAVMERTTKKEEK